MAAAPGNLVQDRMEVPYSTDEKIALMRDLLNTLPHHPKGLRYAQELLLRNPVSMKLSFLCCSQSVMGVPVSWYLFVR